MKGILCGYAIHKVHFWYPADTPKHLQVHFDLIKQQDVNPRTLEEALRRTVTPGTVRMKNMEFIVNFYGQKLVWKSPDCRTKKFVHPIVGLTYDNYMLAFLTFADYIDEFSSDDLRLAGYTGNSVLGITFRHLVDGSDASDKLYWFVRDPLCMNDPPVFEDTWEEASQRIGKFCQTKLTERELAPYIAQALEKQLDFIDPLTAQRADWYEEILSCFKEFRGILGPPIVKNWHHGLALERYFSNRYKEDLAVWEAAGGDELLK